jgi:NTE family protein
MPRIGLVLGGGGIVGQAYHGGVLAGIEQATGWDPRDAAIVVGTSAGAASGAELRAGLSAHDMAARRAGTPFSPDGERLLAGLGPPPQVRPADVEVDVDRARRAFRRLSWRATLSPGSVPPGVLVSVAMSPGRLSAAWLTQQCEWLHAGLDWPAAEFWTCAVDLDGGERVVFGRPGAPEATSGQAVAASCAIPGVFAPVAIGDGLYIDGGGWSVSNADVLADLGLDLVVIVSPMTFAQKGATRRRDGAVRAACRAMLDDEVALIRSGGTAVAVVEPTAAELAVMGHVIGVDVLDEGRCKGVVERARESTARRILSGKLPGLELLAPAAPALAA